MTPELTHKLIEFRNQLIRYDAVKRVLNDLECLHMTGVHAGGAECMLVIGPSGSGKTTALQHYAADHLPVRESERDRLPILLVEAPTRATPKGLAEVMLASLGDPASSKGTLQSMTRRVEALLRARGVELVMLDEFQHLVDRQKTNYQVAYDAADWIKGLLNKSICPIVLSGTNLASSVIEANEQLQRRCMSIVPLGPLPFGTQDERRYFRSILEAFDLELPLKARSGLAEPDLAARIHAATGGLIGRVSQLLTTACRGAMRDGYPCLDASVLGDAWAASATVSNGKMNPFRTRTPPTADLEPDRGPWKPTRGRTPHTTDRPRA